jgi:hypothetical protein
VAQPPMRGEGAGEPDARVTAAQAVHAQGIAVVARGAVADALIASRRADPETIAAESRMWYVSRAGLPGVTDGAAADGADTTAVDWVRGRCAAWCERGAAVGHADGR